MNSPNGHPPSLTTRERELLNAAGLRVQMAREHLAQAHRECADAEGAAKGVLRTVLALKGLNPDAWTYDATGDEPLLVPINGAGGPGSLGTSSPSLREPQLGQAPGKPSD